VSWRCAARRLVAVQRSFVVDEVVVGVVVVVVQDEALAAVGELRQRFDRADIDPR
jgi:hypothetical protein